MDNGGAFTDRLFAEAYSPQGSAAGESGCGGGGGEAGGDLTEAAGGVPVQAGRQVDGQVIEAVGLVDLEAAVGEAADDDAAGFGTHVDREVGGGGHCELLWNGQWGSK